MDVAPEDLIGPLNDVEAKHAPRRLYLAGDQAIVESGPRVAIVGSRKPSQSGMEDTRLLAEFLVRNGVVVVSGLAEGIDSVAHRTALACGGRTLAVIGTPLDRCYPRFNEDLQAKLMREHLVISQFGPGAAVQRKNFPLRNRTMALLAHATVIVEAGDASGSLHQGWEALRLNRPLFMMARVADSAGLVWPGKMKDYGAMVLSSERMEQILDVLPATGVPVDLDVAL